MRYSKIFIFGNVQIIPFKSFNYFNNFLRKPFFFLFLIKLLG